MALTVGTDTYASIEEADDYFFSGYIGAEKWEDSTDEEKEGALRKATQRIDRLKLRGFKSVATQPLQFPRSYSVWIDDEPGVKADAGILPDVKRACIEEAIAVLQGKEIGKRAQLQKQGVTSTRIGRAAETYSGRGAAQTLASLEAQDYLHNYVAAAGALG